MVVEDIVPENLEKIECTHATLEILITEINKKYRALKRALFNIVEKVMRDDEHHF
ncbi:hypothetical protein D3C87_1457270 [compost metagenome]